MKEQPRIPITWKQIERFWYLLSLTVIIGSMPFSKYGLSMGQMMMAGGWIVERFDRNRWIAFMRPLSTSQRIVRIIPYSLWLMFVGIFSGFRDFFRNKPALIFSSVFVLHLAGLLFTTDFSYAFKDLRTKFPILLLALMLSTSQAIGRKTFYRYLLLFIAVVVVRSLYNTWQIAGDRFIDIRDVSQNVSHIIYGLMIAFAIFALLWFVIRREVIPLWLKAIALLALAWLCIYLVISQSFTGIAVSLATLLVLIPMLIFSTGIRWLKIAMAASLLLIPAILAFYLWSLVRDYYHVNPVDYTKLEQATSRGNPYIHNPFSTETENGNYLWLYVQWDEMRSEWNKRSQIPFDSLSRKNETVAFTVVRYLSSKGWRKDGDAIVRLQPKEIEAIERGVTNELFLREFSIRGRMYEILWGYDNYRKTGNPTGSTLMQRLEFWKASLGIIGNSWLTGVGTGDMNEAFRDQYVKMNTRLAPDQRWRSHNQFLSITVGFGILGLAWFLLAILIPPRMVRRYDDYFFLVFLVILLTSMLTNDTIESQTGLSFFAIFYTLLLFARRDKDPLITMETR